MMRIEKKGNGLVAFLEGDLTIYNANAIRDFLLAFLDDSAELELDLSKVNEMDSAAIQLLLSACKQAGRQQKTLRLGALSDFATEVFRLVNLKQFFKTPSATGAIQGGQV